MSYIVNAIFLAAFGLVLSGLSSSGEEQWEIAAYAAAGIFGALSLVLGSFTANRMLVEDYSETTQPDHLDNLGSGR